MDKGECLKNNPADLEVKMKSVYVVENENGNVKIGVSNDVELRVGTLSSQGGFKICNLFYTKPCSNAYEIEKNVHQYFSGKRIKGEWFEVDFLTAKEIVCIEFDKVSNLIPKRTKVIYPEDIEILFKDKKDKMVISERYMRVTEYLIGISEYMSKKLEMQKEMLDFVCEKLKDLCEEKDCIEDYFSSMAVLQDMEEDAALPEKPIYKGFSA